MVLLSKTFRGLLPLSVLTALPTSAAPHCVTVRFDRVGVTD
jgi:hypothetical protein